MQQMNTAAPQLKGRSSVGLANQDVTAVIASAPGQPSSKQLVSLSTNRSIAGLHEVQVMLHAGRPPTTSMNDDITGSNDKDGDAVSRRPSLSNRAHSSDSVEAKKQKRFTLTLPIQTNFTLPAQSGLPSPIRSTAPSTAGSEDAVRPTTPSDTNFLTAIAAQERRVLELKEELAKAEQALQKLKKEWATHEVQKKRQDIKRMRSTRSGPGARNAHRQPFSDDTQAELLAKETERKRAIQHMARTTQRTVFAGSKHARTLSLLSPEPMTGKFSDLPIHDEKAGAVLAPQGLPELPTKISHKRVVSGEMQRSQLAPDGDLDMPREVLMRAGRQMASDFKDGLWTFLEDLRQVTVGEEQEEAQRLRQQKMDASQVRLHTKSGKDRRPISMSETPRRVQKHRKQPSTARKPNARRQDSDDEAEHPSPKDSAVEFEGPVRKTDDLIDADVPSSPAARKTPRRRANTLSSLPRASPDPIDANESWDTWDSPQPQVERLSSTDDPENSKLSSEERLSGLNDLLQSTSPRSKRDPIPWPTLQKLAPSNLRRTASHLMTEWEKSLSPSPGDSGRVPYELFDGTAALSASSKMD